MRHHGDRSIGAQHGDGFQGCELGAFGVGGTVAAQVLVEGVFRIAHVARLHHRLGDVRAADGATR